MSRSGRPTDDKPLPPLYAMTHGGIESTAADEITRDLGGEVKRTARGLVVFRMDQLNDKVLSLRTTEGKRIRAELTATWPHATSPPGDRVVVASVHNHVELARHEA